MKIPFTNIIFGKKAVQKAKESLMYGYYQNTFANLIECGGLRVDFNTLYTIYNNVVDVKMAITKIARACMKEGYNWVNARDEELTPNAMQVGEAERIFNAYRPISILNDLWIRDRYVSGNAYFQIVKSLSGDVYGVKPVDPRTMVIVSDKTGRVLRYVQRLMGKENMEFAPEEIAHHVLDYSTSNPLLGVSPIESIVWEAKTEMASQMSNYYFYENNAVPAHLLIMDEELEESQMQNIKKEIDRNFKGSKNRFKSGIIPYLKDIKTIAPSQKDMKYIETRHLSTKKVVVAFGVDSFILGYTDGVQRGNADVIYKGFYENTVRPQEKDFEEYINNILDLIGLTEIRFKVKPSNYDNEKNVAEVMRGLALSGIVTANEVRRRLGMEESDNELADELMINGIVLDDLGQELEETKTIIRAKQLERDKELYNLLKI